ncbi:sugar ABC transporter permease [Sporolactobacillus sp. THM7-7]|nr:sugar ABC transporter permease [Sporolactobacillus sp. THM7-7]
MERAQVERTGGLPATVAREKLFRRILGRQPAAWLYLMPSLILFAVFVFYPLFKTIYLSFFLSDMKGLPTVFIGLDNYVRLFSSPEFIQSAGSTLLFVLYTVPATIIIALILALLANEKLKGIGFFRTIFSSSMGISVAASSVVWLFIFNPSAGILNRILSLFGLRGINWLADPNWALFSVSLTTIWLHLGFTFLILLGGLQNIDEHLYESANIEGAGYFYQLRRITLPMLSPTLFFVITVSMIDAFQTFGQIDLLTKGGPGNSTNLIVYSIYQKAFINFDFGSASSAVVVLFFCILLVTALQFKFGERKVHYQ